MPSTRRAVAAALAYRQQMLAESLTRYERFVLTHSRWTPGFLYNPVIRSAQRKYEQVDARLPIGALSTAPRCGRQGSVRDECR